MNMRVVSVVLMTLLMPLVGNAQDTGELSDAQDSQGLQNDTTRPTESSDDAAIAAPRVARTPTAARTAAGVEELELDATAITGYEELPRIMHIVPWKPADPGEIPGRPVDSLLNEIIAPVDRQEYRRELRYHDALYGDRPDS